MDHHRTIQGRLVAAQPAGAKPHQRDIFVMILFHTRSTS